MLAGTEGSHAAGCGGAELSELVWHKEPPTVPGWYWVRRASIADAYQFITEVTQSDIYDEKLELALGSDWVWQYEFAGPLPEPIGATPSEVPE